jgi:predicted MPP superfamily phosphohydrolase
LKADAGVYGCMGNHEVFAEAERYTQVAAARVGIRFLRGRSEPLRFGNARLELAGVDYQPISQKAHYLESAGKLVRPEAFNVLLSHNPDVFPTAAKQGYQLVLGGHTHGGQVAIEILHSSINPARFFTPYVQGMYRLPGSTEYVTRGIGTIGIPVRIGSPPEISMLRLRKV